MPPETIAKPNPGSLLDKLKARLGKRSAVRDVATLTLGTVIAQVIAIASMPLLARMYTPADFGLLAVFLAITGVAATLVTLRYETAILIPRQDNEAATLGLLALVLTVAVSVLLGLISILLPVEACAALGIAGLSAWLPLAFVVAGATAFATTAQGWLNRQKKYAQMARLRILQSAGIVSLALFFGLIQLDANGLLLAQTLASLCTAVGALWLARSAALVWQSQQVPAVARSYHNAPRYLLPTAVLDVATMQLPVLLIAMWFGEAQAGQFSMAWRMLMLPMSLVGAAIGQVFIQRLAVNRSNPELAKRLLKRTWLLLLALGLLPLLMIFLFGESMFSLVLGAAWSEAGLMAATLAPMALAMFISSPTSGSFIILGLQKYSLYFGLLTSTYRPLCLFYGYATDDIFEGIKLWMMLEVLVICVYQYIIWRKIKAMITN